MLCNKNQILDLLTIFSGFFFETVSSFYNSLDFTHLLGNKLYSMNHSAPRKNLTLHMKIC